MSRPGAGPGPRASRLAPVLTRVVWGKTPSSQLGVCSPVIADSSLCPREHPARPSTIVGMNDKYTLLRDSVLCSPLSVSAASLLPPGPRRRRGDGARGSRAPSREGTGRRGALSPFPFGAQCSVTGLPRIRVSFPTSLGGVFYVMICYFIF